MKALKWNLFLTILLSGLSSFAANENLLTQKIFIDVCSKVVQPVKNGWALDRTQFDLTDAGLFYSQRKNTGPISEYGVFVTKDGLSTRELISFQNQIRDLKFADGKLWLLFNEDLIAIDPSTGKKLATIRTHSGLIRSVNHEHANEFVIIGSKAYIAHGTYGVEVVDFVAGDVVQQIELGAKQANGHLSKAVGIATDGSSLYVTFDSVTMPTQKDKAFNGLVKVPLNGSRTYTKYDIDNRSSGVITQVIATSVVNGILHMDNWGNLQSLDLASLTKGASFSAPYKRVLFPFENKDYSVEFLGDIYVANGTYYGCGKISPDDASTHTIRRKGVLATGSL